MKLYHIIIIIAKNMDKNNKWSILIWSMFLILFISFSFMFISSKIQKNILKTNYDFIYDESISEQSLFSIDSSWFLKKWEDLIFEFDKENKVNIEVKWYWTVEYTIYSWSTITRRWLIKEELNNLDVWKNLKITWLSGLSKIKITFNENDWIILPYNYKKIYKNIWGTVLLKEFIRE